VTVELDASTELVETIGPDRFAHYLAMFGATIRATRPTDFGIRITYTLDVPDAPPGAARVVPTYQTTADGTVSILHLDWYDAVGHVIHPQPPEPTH